VVCETQRGNNGSDIGSEYGSSYEGNFAMLNGNITSIISGYDRPGIGSHFVDMGI
jgi:hypothetical protein